MLQSEHFTSVLNQLDLKDMLHQLPALTPDNAKSRHRSALLQEPQVLFWLSKQTSTPKPEIK